MTAKEIIKNVCIYLGKEEILNSSFFETDGQEITTAIEQDLNKILKCLNYITEELATEYFSLTKKKEIKLASGTIIVKDIDDNIYEVLSVKTRSGKTLRYQIVDNKLICLANCVQITYKVYPNQIGLNDKAEDFNGKISARIIAYGVASEYCFLDMLYDDAALWENRYKNALLVAQRKKGEIKLKKRGWF
ncbi:MAG: hypothetical protein E7376_04865 [Clostridiales bacterium]|nr:hypothetical protein [Clostridiales bacterium]